MHDIENETGRGGPRPLVDERLSSVRGELGLHIRREEAAAAGSARPPDTLVGHLERVAALAVRLAAKEGVDPLQAEIAALFHDAGKFRGGRYHDDEQPEEEHSVSVLLEMGPRHGLGPELLEPAARAIRQLYRDDPELSPLSRVLSDADNLDKLGLPGIALYFIKSGLRGRGLSPDLVVRLTVELTYARHAAQGLFTRTARSVARKRSGDTVRFIHDLLDALREDGTFDARIERVRVCGLDLEVITPAGCPCGAAMGLKTRTEKGTKCTEIHLEMTCENCSNRHVLRFCRPRLVGEGPCR